MDPHGHFYELTDAQRKALAGDGYEGEKIDGATYEQLQQDVARLDGYLKGRVDSDRPKRLGEGIGEKRGPGANKDVSG